KFNDADLIGLPLRITVGARSLEQGGVELKRRDQAERQLVAVDDIVATVAAELAAMQAELDKTVPDSA
ncbi:MAG: proline--tRNA ligase, partial [Anaerolineae bacterium]|nr:proline--tRNA ligase [Anaerolineae bacterium]